MPRGRQPEGETTLSNAERQARYRARHKDDRPTPVVRVRYRRPADRRSRPQRWDDAVAELLALQVEYTAWYDALPDGLRDTATGRGPAGHRRTRSDGTPGDHPAARLWP
jgi:hypothetical protein